jgi:hypothetical protein
MEKIRPITSVPNVLNKKQNLIDRRFVLNRQIAFMSFIKIIIIIQI